MEGSDYHYTEEIYRCALTDEACSRNNSCKFCETAKQHRIREEEEEIESYVLGPAHLRWSGKETNALVDAYLTVAEFATIDDAKHVLGVNPDNWKEVRDSHNLYLPLFYPRLYQYIKLHKKAFPDYYLIRTDREFPILAVYEKGALFAAACVMRGPIDVEDKWQIEIVSPYSHCWGVYNPVAESTKKRKEEKK